MNSFDLPWTVGPVPIILTIWSAIIFGRTASSRRALKIGSGNIASAFLLSLAFSSVLFQVLYPYGGLEISIFSQFLVAITCCISTGVVNSISKEETDFPRKDLSMITGVKVFIVSVLIFIAFNTFYFLFGGKNSCVGPRCYVFSFLFGRNDRIFSTLYIGYAAPTIFLTLSLFIILQMLKKLRLHFRAR